MVRAVRPAHRYRRPGSSAGQGSHRRSNRYAEEVIVGMRSNISDTLRDTQYIFVFDRRRNVRKLWCGRSSVFTFRSGSRGLERASWDQEGERKRIVDEVSKDKSDGIELDCRARRRMCDSRMMPERMALWPSRHRTWHSGVPCERKRLQWGPRSPIGRTVVERHRGDGFPSPSSCFAALP
jgi:hypothetical protein